MHSSRHIIGTNLKKSREYYPSIDPIYAIQYSLGTIASSYIGLSIALAGNSICSHFDNCCQLNQTHQYRISQCILSNLFPYSNYYSILLFRPVVHISIDLIHHYVTLPCKDQQHILTHAAAAHKLSSGWMQQRNDVPLFFSLPFFFTGSQALCSFFLSSSLQDTLTLSLLSRLGFSSWLSWLRTDDRRLYTPHTYIGSSTETIARSHN